MSVMYTPYFIKHFPEYLAFDHSAQQDAIFDLVSMEFNVALWHTKHASRLAGKEE